MYKSSLDETEAYEYLFRIVIVGDSGVGKTNLLYRYTKNIFAHNTSSTIGLDFAHKDVKIEDAMVRAYIWDTAGQEKFRSIITNYYKGSIAAILVYDITKYETFKNITKWLNEIRKNCDNDIIIYLIGNKADLFYLRQVERKEAEAFAEENELIFIEASALDSTNVEKAFENLLKDVFKAMIDLDDGFVDQRVKTVKLNRKKKQDNACFKIFDSNSKLNSNIDTITNWFKNPIKNIKF